MITTSHFDPSMTLMIAAQITLALFILAGLIAFYRIARGPGLTDRVVGLDFLNFLIVGFIGALAILKGDPRFLDVAIALALVAFLATVAFARYIERLCEHHNPPPEKKKEMEP